MNKSIKKYVKEPHINNYMLHALRTLPKIKVPTKLHKKQTKIFLKS